MKTSTIDTIGSASATTSVTAGGFTALFSFMAHDILFGVVGVLITIGTFLMSWYYKRKSDARAEAAERRREAEHQLRMDLMRQKGRLLIDPASEPVSDGF